MMPTPFQDAGPPEASYSTAFRTGTPPFNPPRTALNAFYGAFGTSVYDRSCALPAFNLGPSRPLLGHLTP